MRVDLIRGLFWTDGLVLKGSLFVVHKRHYWGPPITEAALRLTPGDFAHSSFLGFSSHGIAAYLC